MSLSDLEPVLKQVLHIVKRIYVNDDSMLNTFLLAQGAKHQQVVTDFHDKSSAHNRKQEWFLSNDHKMWLLFYDDIHINGLMF